MPLNAKRVSHRKAGTRGWLVACVAGGEAALQPLGRGGKVPGSLLAYTGGNGKKSELALNGHPPVLINHKANGLEVGSFAFYREKSRGTTSWGPGRRRDRSQSGAKTEKTGRPPTPLFAGKSEGEGVN